MRRLQRWLRSRDSLIDCYDRLIIVEILHRMVEKDGCSGGDTKRDGFFRFLRTRNWMVSKLHALGMMWNFIVGFHGRWLSHHSEPRMLTSGPPCLTVSKKTSNQQRYCSETHPACRFNTKKMFLARDGLEPKFTPRHARGDQ